MSLISCTDLTLGYDSRAVASGITFSVESGDYLCVVGENGSGKSTLMKTVLGLEQPLSGEIIFGEHLGKNEIGYLPQQTQVQKDFPATVWEIVLSGTLSSLGAKPFYTKEAKRTAEENLERMGITHLKKRCYRELSGGQQQRVLLARALCATRKLLLLDEPVAGLDPAVTNELYELISGLNAQGVSIIMISHDVNAIRYANKVLSIGAEVFFGTVKEFASRDNIFTSGGVRND